MLVAAGASGGCLLDEFTVAHTDIPEDNLTSNPSFEVGLESWISWQGILSREPHPQAPDGEWVVQVSMGAGDSFSLDDEPDTLSSAPTGDCFVASVDVAAGSESARGKPVTLVLRELVGESDPVQETMSDAIALDEEFVTVAVSAIVSGVGNNLDIYVQQDQAAAGDAFFADRVLLQRFGPEPDVAACARNLP